VAGILFACAAALLADLDITQVSSFNFSVTDRSMTGIALWGLEAILALALA